MARFVRTGLPGVEVRVEGRTIIETTERVETGGPPFETQTFERHDERAARIGYYRRIAELLEDGWRRTSRFVDDIATPIDPLELVVAVDAGEPGALDVFVDWLLEQGDPRGELARLRAVPEPDERAIASLEKTRGVELFGPLAMLSRRWHEQFAYLWSAGWVDEIVFRRVAPDRGAVPPEAELMQHVMHAPMARFARRLTVDDWYLTPLWECLRDDPALSWFRSVCLVDSELAVEDHAVARRRLAAIGIELTSPA